MPAAVAIKIDSSKSKKVIRNTHKWERKGKKLKTRQRTEKRNVRICFARRSFTSDHYQVLFFLHRVLYFQLISNSSKLLQIKHSEFKSAFFVGFVYFDLSAHKFRAWKYSNDSHRGKLWRDEKQRGKKKWME